MPAVNSYVLEADLDSPSSRAVPNNFPEVPSDAMREESKGPTTPEQTKPNDLEEVKATPTAREESRGAPRQHKSILIDSFSKKNRELAMLEREGLTAAVCTYSGKVLKHTLSSLLRPAQR